MNELAAATDFEALIREAMLYLAVVDGFRAESCEPTWRPELPSRETGPPRRPSRGRRSSAARG
jgi:hypothetical protein